MTLNCKVGDIAVHVNAIKKENIGKIVKVLSYNGLYGVYHAWLAECDGMIRPSLDCHLRPIRDNDGEDETLTWAPVPNKATT